MNIANTINTAFDSPVISRIARHRDLIVVVGVVAVLIVMVLPIPTVVVDMLLTLNLAVALMILLVSMYNKEALEFSVFPSLLLAVTLFRLSLNVATTRLILTQADAGRVIDVFGNFVTRGNPIVGLVIFIIIVIIQFVVITKGAGRIAEVAARFTLDAMPGKQMSIDADLNSGLITEDQARQRREDISREADFYGAMDGASKFVRGDAVAGIIITVVNIVGGFIIGMLMRGMSLSDAAYTYTLLTIGDRLVSQIPALMISTGAGVLVSRAASETNLGEEITSQLFSNPRVIGTAGAVMLFFAAVPGFPKPPFIFLGLVGVASAYMAYQRGKRERKEKAAPPPSAAHEEERVEDYLHVDPMELEIGYGLIPLVDVKQGGDLLDRISLIRRQLASDLGVIIPPIRIRDNIQLKPNQYRVKMRTILVGEGELMSGAYLAMNPGTATKKVRGIKTTEPAFGLPALWITESQKETAEMAGYTVVELPAVLATHLTELIKRHAAQLITRQDVQHLLDNVKETNQAVVEELVPNLLSVGEVHKVLQGLLREKVSIRDLPRILETLADVAPKNKSTEVLIEYVRNALASQICEQHKNEEGVIPVITMDPNLEARLEGSLEESDAGFRLTLSPQDAGRIIEAIGAQVKSTRDRGQTPLVICSPTIRSQVKRLSETNYPDLIVLSYNEIVPGVEIRSTGMISLEAPQAGTQQGQPPTTT
ncbi:MAG: flagellar biosynthesis protein FlhA [Chitinivibrionales bacterium]|nr:flagellar biosynthesis protein FlhA [Chitinivibrionales bacterium]MBD3394033.1 flagellar biosynthesis protein FlhA [Chitinivibrionales bacterium]